MLERQCCHPAVAQLIDYDFFNSLGVLGKYNFRLKFAYLKNIHAPSYDTPAGHSRWADLILENAKREGLLLQHFSNDDDSRVR